MYRNQGFDKARIWNRRVLVTTTYHDAVPRQARRCSASQRRAPARAGAHVHKVNVFGRVHNPLLNRTVNSVQIPFGGSDRSETTTNRLCRAGLSC